MMFLQTAQQPRHAKTDDCFKNIFTSVWPPPSFPWHSETRLDDACGPVSVKPTPRHRGGNIKGARGLAQYASCQYYRPPPPRAVNFNDGWCTSPTLVRSRATFGTCMVHQSVWFHEKRFPPATASPSELPVTPFVLRDLSQPARDWF